MSRAFAPPAVCCAVTGSIWQMLMTFVTVVTVVQLMSSVLAALITGWGSLGVIAWTRDLYPRRTLHK